MDTVRDIISNLYSKFLLRDIFGRIGPGLIVLLSFYYYFHTDNTSLNILPSPLTGWTWISIFIVAWIIGITLHGIGELTSLIKNSPKGITLKDWIREYFSEFLRDADNFEREADERIAVVKEASGIGSIALIFLFVSIILKYLRDNHQFICADLVMIIILGIAILSLIIFHKNHVQLQRDLVDELKRTRYNSKKR